MKKLDLIIWIPLCLVAISIIGVLTSYIPATIDKQQKSDSLKCDCKALFLSNEILRNATLFERRFPDKNIPIIVPDLWSRPGTWYNTGYPPIDEPVIVKVPAEVEAGYMVAWWTGQEWRYFDGELQGVTRWCLIPNE
jgi:hypothetical protein